MQFIQKNFEIILNENNIKFVNLTELINIINRIIWTKKETIQKIKIIMRI